VALPKTLSKQTIVVPTAEDEAAAVELLRRAHERAVRTPLPEVAAQMQDLFGQKIVAVVAGVDDPRAIGKWARGQRAPRGDAEPRLRAAYQVALLLILGDSADAARAWFLGMNPLLADRAPYAILGEGLQSSQRVMQAARAFLAHG
jgi:hypothetical protein